MWKTILILTLILIAIVSIAIIGSQETIRYGIDRTVDALDRQPSAAELIMESRQTPPVESGGNTLWFGAGIAAIVMIVLAFVLAYLLVGERWMKQRRSYMRDLRKSGRRPAPPTITTIPYANVPQIRQVPRIRRISELPPPPTEGQDYGY